MDNLVKVLDKGFVRLEEFAGGDNAVVRAARVSYGPRPPDEVKDKKLIRYMLEHEHGTPFEKSMFEFHVKAPIFVFRQWHRTRIGVSYNEKSARYSEMGVNEQEEDAFYIPTLWRAPEKGPGANKQGSVAAELDHVRMTRILETSCRNAMSDYRMLLELGAAKEMARMVLPVDLFSEMYVTFNARSLMFFIALRSDTHAQAETRLYSHAMALFLRDKMPWTWDAFADELEEREARRKCPKNYSELWAYIEAADQLAEDLGGAAAAGIVA